MGTACWAIEWVASKESARFLMWEGDEEEEEEDTPEAAFAWEPISIVPLEHATLIMEMERDAEFFRFEAIGFGLYAYEIKSIYLMKLMLQTYAVDMLEKRKAHIAVTAEFDMTPLYKVVKRVDSTQTFSLFLTPKQLSLAETMAMLGRLKPSATLRADAYATIVTLVRKVYHSLLGQAGIDRSKRLTRLYNLKTRDNAEELLTHLLIRLDEVGGSNPKKRNFAPGFLLPYLYPLANHVHSVRPSVIRPVQALATPGYYPSTFRPVTPAWESVRSLKNLPPLLVTTLATLVGVKYPATHLALLKLTNLLFSIGRDAFITFDRDIFSDVDDLLNLKPVSPVEPVPVLASHIPLSSIEEKKDLPLQQALDELIYPQIPLPLAPVSPTPLSPMLLPPTPLSPMLLPPVPVPPTPVPPTLMDLEGSEEDEFGEDEFGGEEEELMFNLMKEDRDKEDEARYGPYGGMFTSGGEGSGYPGDDEPELTWDNYRGE